MAVQVLLDVGSLDNFIQPCLAHFLKLPIAPTKHLKVLVGNDNYLMGEGLIKELPLKIQGHLLTVLVFMLPITGFEIMLGASWLATLRPHIADYSNVAINILLYKIWL